MADETSVREARFADRAAVAALQTELGIVPDSHNDWERIWNANPARSDEIPIGWVLEHQGKVVGYVGNVPREYNLGGRRLITASARGWVVHSDFRSHTVPLLLRYLRQANVDLILNSSSNDVAYKIFTALRAKLMPVAAYDSLLFWVTSPSSLAVSALRKHGVPPALAAPLGWCAGRAWQATQYWRMRGLKNRFRSLLEGSGAGRLQVTQCDPANIGEEYDQMWSAKQSEARRFLADRSSQSLKWFLGRSEKRVTLVQCFSGARLLGYLAMIRRENRVGFERDQILDLIALDDDAAVIQLLLLKARELSSLGGSTVLEMVGFPLAVRRLARELNARSWTIFPTPFTYKVVNRELDENEFSKSEIWYPSLFDGDSGL